jgi:AcrR family transcriptional regulator
MLCAVTSATRSPNQRGIETRKHILKVAVEVLASGDPSSVSANHVAKVAGVSWGTVQYHFGDADGTWAAVIDHSRDATDRALPASLATLANADGSVAERVEAIVEAIWMGYETPIARALLNLRFALPHDLEVLRSEYPKSARALASHTLEFDTIYERFFDGIGAPPSSVIGVRQFLPGAVLGLLVQQRLATMGDVEVAKRSLIDAVVAYLQA